MKKLSLLVTMVLFLASLFLVSNVYALPKISVSFDHTGSQNYLDYKNFQFASMNNYFTLPEDTLDANGDPLGSSGDILTADMISVQEIATGLFTETFMIELWRGQETNDAYQTWGNIEAELDLQGQYIDDDNINFTGGTAKMIDTDAGIDIARFNFSSALTSNLDGSLVGGEALGMNVDIEFIYDWVDPDYFGPDEQDLVNKKWLLAFAATRIDQDEFHIGSDDYYIEWQLQGGRIEHAAVPEPTTLLLFGTGLLGLAAFGRRKFMKKS